MIKNITKNQKLLQTIRIIEDQCIFCFVKSVLKQYPTVLQEVRFSTNNCNPFWSTSKFTNPYHIYSICRRTVTELIQQLLFLCPGFNASRQTTARLRNHSVIQFFKLEGPLEQFKLTMKDDKIDEKTRYNV